MGLVGVSGWLLINTLSFVAILLALAGLKWRPRLAEVRPRASMGEELRDGLRYVTERESLWVPVAIGYAVAALAMAFTRLLPVYASEVLRVGVRGYGALQAAPGLGAILASLAVAARGSRPGALRRLFVSVGVLVAGLGLFAGSRQLTPSLLALALVGGAQMTFRATALALCHQATDDAHRGRVMSIFLLDYGLWSFGTLWLGWLCDAYGPVVAVLTGAGSCLLVTATVAWASHRRASGPPLAV
jgi:hypothetical protein